MLKYWPICNLAIHVGALLNMFEFDCLALYMPIASMFIV